MNVLTWYCDSVGSEYKRYRLSEGWKGKLVGGLCVVGMAIALPIAAFAMYALVAPPWFVMRTVMQARAFIERRLLYRSPKSGRRIVTTSDS